MASEDRGPARSGPLSGYKVLELARLAPGQVAGMILADLGAEVLRIEEPVTASRGPESQIHGDARSHAAYAPNRGKRSIVLDLKSEGGLDVFRGLVERADALFETYRPGVMDRLGIGYEALSRLNPRLVFCSLSGYGQTGPLRDMPGHDLNYIALAGMASLIGVADRRRPAVPGVLIADFAGGSLHAALGIVAALLARERTGAGQYLDLSMVEGSMTLLAAQMALYQIAQSLAPPGEGMLNGGAPYYNLYETADGRFLSVGALEPYFWANLCTALGLEDLIDLQHAIGAERDMVVARLDDVFRRRTRDDWVDYLRDKNTCVAPVLEFNELAGHPQHQARQMLLDVASEDGNALQQIGVSLKLSGTPASPGGLPPRRGQHTDFVLRELGMTEEEIRDLRASGAVE